MLDRRSTSARWPSRTAPKPLPPGLPRRRVGNVRRFRRGSPARVRIASPNAPRERRVAERRGTREAIERRGALVAACDSCGLVVVSAGSAGGEPGASKYTATALTPDTTYVGGEVALGRARRLRRRAARPHGLPPVNVVHQVRLRRDGLLHGRHHRPEGRRARHVTHKSLKHNRAAVRAYQRYAKNFSRKVTGASRRRCRARRCARTFTNATAAFGTRSRRTRSADLLKSTASSPSSSDSLQQPHDDNTDFIGATAVWPSLGGSAQRRLERDRRRHRHRRLARAPDALAPRASRAPAGGIKGCQFGNGSDVGAPRPDVRLQQQAGRRATRSWPRTWRTSAPTRTSSATTRPTCARRATRRVTARTRRPRRRRLRPVGRALRRRARAGLRHRPGRARRACTASAQRRAASAPTRWPRSSRRSRDGVNVINFSISGGGDPYSDPVELAFLDAYNAGISVNASAGNSGPAAATTDHGGPWVHDRGRIHRPAVLHVDAEPDRGRRGDLRACRASRSRTGSRRRRPVILAQSIPGEDVLCQTQLTTAAADRCGIRARSSPASAARTPAWTRASTSWRAARPG